jgi:hypothetical protein
MLPLGHGSSLENWHSITRSGLDFKVVKNGRAYGNGVYLAKYFHTSLGYSNRHGRFVAISTSSSVSASPTGNRTLQRDLFGFELRFPPSMAHNNELALIDL